MAERAKPFEVSWAQAAVAKILGRVKDFEFPPAPEGAGWSLGCDAAFLKRLQEHWLGRYDWRAAVKILNRYPQFTAQIDGLDIHYVHVVGEAKGKRPLIITHGWPGSHFEFWDIIEPLAFPSRFGGKPEDAFDLVVPSLPGFGFSGKPKGPMGQRATARIWNTLMTEVLGYKHYLAQGGDWGSIVSSWLGLDFTGSLKALHLNMAPFRTMAPPQNDEEAAWMGRAQAAQMALSGYSALQMSKPQSLAWATAGNPLGQAAWIVERFHDWADLRERPFEQVFSLDHLLTNVMIYVMTGSFVSAAWYYRGVVDDGFVILPPGTRCETPTAYAAFAHDTLMPVPPRSRVALTYNLSRWTDPPRGGHFAAMEAPDLFIDDVRAWGREAWPLQA